ncbi:MAG: ClpX C4-type zinc finger protein [Chloroflexota bacterium]
MARIVILRGDAKVIGPHLGPINWQGLRADLQRLWPRYVPIRSPVPAGAAACCSFCGKDHRGRRLIGGPNHLFICNECIARCQTMLNESPAPRPH